MSSGLETKISLEFLVLKRFVSMQVAIVANCLEMSWFDALKIWNSVELFNFVCNKGSFQYRTHLSDVFQTFYKIIRKKLFMWVRSQIKAFLWSTSYTV